MTRLATDGDRAGRVKSPLCCLSQPLSMGGFRDFGKMHEGMQFPTAPRHDQNRAAYFPQGAHVFPRPHMQESQIRSVTPEQLTEFRVSHASGPGRPSTSGFGRRSWDTLPIAPGNGPMSWDNRRLTVLRQQHFTATSPEPAKPQSYSRTMGDNWGKGGPRIANGGQGDRLSLGGSIGRLSNGSRSSAASSLYMGHSLTANVLPITETKSKFAWATGFRPAASQAPRPVYHTISGSRLRKGADLLS